jgi:hypothetical protein
LEKICCHIHTGIKNIFWVSIRVIEQIKEQLVVVSIRVTDAATVDGHIDDLSLDTRFKGFVTVAEHEGLGCALRVPAAVTLDTQRAAT